MRLFISYNKSDREVARQLGVQLQIVGEDVWFDEWEVRAGDSIPGAVGTALEELDAFVLVWSSDAARSKWVRAELEAAIVRGMSEESLRVIPVMLDDTALPALVAANRWVDLSDGDIGTAVNDIARLHSNAERIKAIQAFLEDSGIQVEWFHGYGPAVGCPRCGAAVSELQGWSQTDYNRDDTYAGVRCKRCGWEDGGEV